MIAEITGHGNRAGYIVEILYSSDEIEMMIEAGISDQREKHMGDVREHAQTFCDRWNRRYGNGCKYTHNVAFENDMRSY